MKVVFAVIGGGFFNAYCVVRDKSLSENPYCHPEQRSDSPEGALASRKSPDRRKLLKTNPFRHSERSEEPLSEGLLDDQ